jgi:hypothetical protein
VAAALRQMDEKKSHIAALRDFEECDKIADWDMGNFLCLLIQ